MVDFNKLLPLFRMGAMGTVTLFSIIVFCISAHMIAMTNAFRAGAYYHFSALSLATSILTLLTVPAMYYVSIKRQGAFSSWICVEIAWLWFLWIMWISSAGSTAALYWVNFCSGGICSEAQALEAFGFLNWIILVFYVTTLVVLSVMAHVRGRQDVWKSEVARYDWNAPPALKPVGGVVQVDGGVATPVVGSYQPEMKAPQQQYPPQQQQQVPYVGAPVNNSTYSPQV